MQVSVLMSVYKEDSIFLRESIESILNQTYDDFEFIIVGDSPQSDRERVFGIVQEYASKDSRIKFFPNETNIGLTRSLNVGLCHCKGKYIARMDADDISVPTRLEKQVAFMQSNPQILASSAWYELINEDGEKTGRIVYLHSTKKIRLEILKNSVLGHPVSFFHRLINDIPVRYDETVKYAQDYSLWVWILQYGEISNIQEVLLYYRLSKDQISSAHLSEQQLCAKIAQRKAFESLYGFPYIKSFMDIFYYMTIGYDNKLSEKIALPEFQNFFNEVNVTKRNYGAIKYIMDIYTQFFPIKSGKRYFQFIYGLTKKNKKLLVLCEIDYFYHKLIGVR